jgi:micrococcal nuclease
MGWNVTPLWQRKRFDWLEGITPRKRSRRFPIKPAALGLVVGILMASVALWLPPDLSQLSRVIPDWLSPEYFRLCHIGGGYNCVVDGDTFHYHFTTIRIADIDTPETHPPRCAHEAELGRRATLRLQELLNLGPFTLEAIDRDRDQYGRELKIVMRGGASLGERLVNEGLARRWTGSRRPWC